MGCDDRKPPPGSEAPLASATSNETKKSTPAASNDNAPSGATQPKPLPPDANPVGTKEGGVAGSACLAGKWHYDFADDAAETMIANLPQGKVTKEEGELICESTLAGNEGTWTCQAAGGKPVVIEVSVDQAGMPLAINVKMTGKTTSKFKLVDEKTIEFTSARIGDLKVDVEATVAGNKIPFPATPLLQALSGEMGGTSSFECHADELRLRTHIDGKTSWQKLRRLK